MHDNPASRASVSTIQGVLVLPCKVRRPRLTLRSAIAAEQSLMDELVTLCRDHTVTFVFAVRDAEHNSSIALRDDIGTQIESAS